MKKIMLMASLCGVMSAQAELKALDETEMESVSGKGIRIDANVDFADAAAFQDQNWIAYRRILVDENGNVLTDSDNDGYINLHGGGVNIDRRNSSHTNREYNWRSPDASAEDYQIRKPYYVMIGAITGGISFEGLEMEMVQDFAVDFYTPQEFAELNLPDDRDRLPALPWTMPEKIKFNNFEIEGIYVSEDAVIDKPYVDNNGVFHGDNKLLGARLDGPIYMPSSTSAYVFVTSD